MGLMQRKMNIPPVSFTYNMDYSTRYLIVGLGNPGKEYALNYHNIGYLAVDSYVQSKQSGQEFTENKKFDSLIAEINLDNNKIFVCKPLTFMNNSGDAVKKIVEFYKIKKDKIIAIYDDFDLEFGLIRTRPDGSSAGHNGIESIINQIGDEFNRIRIGIKSKDLHINKSAGDIVLKNFSKIQQSSFSDLFKEINSILTEFIYSKSEQIPSETRNFLLK